MPAGKVMIMGAARRLISINMSPRFRPFSLYPRAAWISIAQRFRSSSLHFKIAFFTVVLLTCTSLVLFVITLQITNDYILNEIIKRGESVGKSIAASAGYSMLSNDLLGLDNLVFKAQAANTDMTYAAILDQQMQTVVDSNTPAGIKRKVVVEDGRLLREAADGTTVREYTGLSGVVLEIMSPVVFMEQSLGSVVIGMNKSVLTEARRKVANRLVMVFGTIVVVGMFASTLLASFLMRPIRELSAGVDEMKKGTTKDPLRIYANDELGRLTANFNEMSALIAEQQGDLNRYARDLENAYVSIVKVVAAAIDARDSYTHGHSARVARLSLLIGKRIGLSQNDLGTLKIACLFHDVGKIKTPDSILLKRTKLNKDEYDEMMKHVEYGASILSWAPSLVKYIPSTRHHHEWYNGEGYPDGLSGDSIPLFAAIISIADAYDAMTTDRPYRKAFSEKRALQEIASMSGKQFQPDLVEEFLLLMGDATDTEIAQPVLEYV
jgi:HD-GYP domain-containing protein (c-di-GMP phosphodiesterase class II)